MVMLTEVLLPTDHLGVTHTAAGEPEGPDGGTLHGLGRGRLRAGAGRGGGGGQRQQHLRREERFGDCLRSR